MGRNPTQGMGSSPKEDSLMTTKTITMKQIIITTTTIIRSMTMETRKAVHADDLLYIASESVRNDFNRTIDTQWLKAHLDPNGVSLVTLILPFHNMDFAAIPHHRCSVLAKFTATNVPEEFYLDITESSYNKLFGVERVIPANPVVDKVLS